MNFKTHMKSKRFLIVYAVYLLDETTTYEGIIFKIKDSRLFQNMVPWRNSTQERLSLNCICEYENQDISENEEHQLPYKLELKTAYSLMFYTF